MKYKNDVVTPPLKFFAAFQEMLELCNTVCAGILCPRLHPRCTPISPLLACCLEPSHCVPVRRPSGPDTVGLPALLSAAPSGWKAFPTACLRHIPSSFGKDSAGACLPLDPCPSTCHSPRSSCFHGASPSQERVGCRYSDGSSQQPVSSCPALCLHSLFRLLRHSFNTYGLRVHCVRSGSGHWATAVIRQT